MDERLFDLVARFAESVASRDRSAVMEAGVRLRLFCARDVRDTRLLLIAVTAAEECVSQLAHRPQSEWLRDIWANMLSLWESVLEHKLEQLARDDVRFAYGVRRESIAQDGGC